ncbi:unnamed protein product [Victoria cruziana]
MSIVKELQGTVFLLDPLERQVGDDVILLLHQDRNCGTNFNEMSELEAFHQAAIKLGIISLASALAERRALKKLVEMARCENDKRKEIIVSYLLHLMRKYSKIFRSECPDDVDSQGSTPCSPTVHGSVEEGVGSAQAIDGQLLKFGSLNINPNGRRSGNLPVTPEEFRCPISLQLMYDPVIIASGQTYERVCIENWFSHGHDTCPKTQQKLSHLYLTPNYCVKGLIGSWCEQNGVSFPDQPPDSLDLDYWKWNLSQCENINTGSTEDDVSGLVKESKFVPLVDNDDFDGPEKHDEMGTGDNCLENIKISPDQGYQRLLGLLNSEEDIKTKCKAAEEIRFLLKDNEEARICMGENGFANPLVGFLRTGIQERNEKAQETGTMALFNLAVGNDRNKELIIAAGVLPLLEEVQQSSSYEAATALYLNLSCSHEAKGTIGSSGAIPFLVGCLRQPKTQCRFDALQAVYNLSTLASNIPHLLAAGAVANLAHILSGSGNTWPDKVIAVLCNLAPTKQGKTEIIMFPGLLGLLASALDSGTQIEQEQATSCFLSLCVGDEQCSQLVLQEGVVPSLVSLSINGTSRGKDKAQKLLVHFRELREREPVHSSSQPSLTETGSTRGEPVEREVKSVIKFKSKSNRLGRALSSMWKAKLLSMYRF